MKKKMKVVKVLKPEDTTDLTQKVIKKSLRVKDNPDVVKENLIKKMDSNIRTEVPATGFLGQDTTLGSMINAFKDKFGEELTLDHFVPLATNLNPIEKVVPLPLITPYNDIYKESSKLADSDNDLLNKLFEKVIKLNLDDKNSNNPDLYLYNQLFKDHYYQIRGYRTTIFRSRCHNAACQHAQSFIANAENVMHIVYMQFLKDNNIEVADLFKNQKILKDSCESVVYIFEFVFTSLLEYRINGISHSFCVANDTRREDEKEEEFAEYMDKYYSQSIMPHAVNIGEMKLYNFVEDNIIKFIDQCPVLTFNGDIEQLYEDLICSLYPLFDSVRTSLIRTMHLLRNEYMKICSENTDPIYNYTKDDFISNMIQSDFNIKRIENFED